MPKSNGRAPRGAEWKAEAREKREKKKLAKEHKYHLKIKRDFDFLVERKKLFKTQIPGTLFDWFNQSFLLITWVPRDILMGYSADDPMGYEGLFVTKNGITRQTWSTFSGGAKIIGKVKSSH